MTTISVVCHKLCPQTSNLLTTKPPDKIVWLSCYPHPYLYQPQTAYPDFTRFLAHKAGARSCSLLLSVGLSLPPRRHPFGNWHLARTRSGASKGWRDRGKGAARRETEKEREREGKPLYPARARPESRALIIFGRKAVSGPLARWRSASIRFQECNRFVMPYVHVSVCVRGYVRVCMHAREVRGRR